MLYACLVLKNSNELQKLQASGYVLSHTGLELLSKEEKAALRPGESYGEHFRWREMQKKSRNITVILFTNKEIEDIFPLQDDDNLQFSIIHSITLMLIRRY